MFPKQRRIPRKIFPLLSNGAKTFRNKLFLLRFVVVEGSKSRFSFSVSKKISKSAVVRNRLRRTGYKYLKEHLSAIKPNTLVQFSFVTNPKDNMEVGENIESILKLSKLLE